MRKHSWKVITLALILSISAILVSASSSNASSRFIFEVNFDFQIGNTKYSKGKYRLSSESQKLFLLTNLTGSGKAFLGIHSNGTLSRNDKSRLTFHRYGDKYFLRKVISPAGSARVKMSRDEKDARQNSHQKVANVKITNLFE